MTKGMTLADKERIAMLAINHFATGSYMECDFEGTQIDNREFLEKHTTDLDEIEMQLLDLVCENYDWSEE